MSHIFSDPPTLLPSAASWVYQKIIVSPKYLVSREQCKSERRNKVQRAKEMYRPPDIARAHKLQIAQPRFEA